MRKMIAAFCLCLSTLILQGGCDTRATDKEDMEVLIQTLDSCNNSSDGNGILGIFTQSTWDHNDALIKLALEGTEAEVKALHMADRMEVLRMRLRSNRAELSKLKGMEYTRFATSRGWYVLPREDRALATLTKFKFSPDGNEAWANLVHDGEPSNTRIHFIKEGGQWRYDEPDAMKSYSADYQFAARAERVPENRFIFNMLEQETGKDVPETIWQPLSAAETLEAPLLPPPR